MNDAPVAQRTEHPTSNRTAVGSIPTGGAAPLTDRERAILDLEKENDRYAGRKSSTIRERFACTETRYYQELRGLLTRPAALEYAPTVINRLRAGIQGRHREPTARVP